MLELTLTKKKSAEKFIEEKGDYLFVTKDNEATLRKDIELFIQNEELDKYTKSELNGGRIEKRTAYTTSDIDWLYGRKTYPQ